MADNVTIPAQGTGDTTPVIVTDDVSGVHYPISKLDGGGDGLSVPIVSGQQAMAASLPVVVASNQTAIPVSGTVAITSATLATEATLSSLNAKVTAVNTGAVVVSSSALPTLATSTKQSDGTQKTQIVDGSGNVIASTSNALNVAVTAGSSVIGHVIVDSGTLTAVTALTNALPAGSNVIGHVIADTGSTTAVTGNVTVIQGTATSLKAQAEAYQGGSAVGSGNPLQVTLANTGANATPVAVSLASAPSTSVTQGTSPWIVAGGGTAGSAATGVATIQGIASMTPVQVSQATASNLNATVIGTGAAGTAATGVVTVQGIASMTKLLVTPDSVALPANQSVNVAQLAGTTAATNSGNKDAGTLRVVIATDQVAMTNAQPANITQVAGATISQGHGTAATAIRVELPTDGTGVIATVGAVTEITNALPTGDNFIGLVALSNDYSNLTNLTTTNFSGLTTGNAWQSVAIDAGGSGDIHFEFQTVGAAGSTLYVDFYIAETLSNGTVYTDGATGTEGTFTAANRKNSRYLGSMLCNGTSAVQACMKLSDIFAVIPKKFAIIAINNSGGTISATGGNTVFDWAHVN